MAGRVWWFFTILNPAAGCYVAMHSRQTRPQSAGGFDPRKTSVHPLPLGVRNLRYKLSHLPKADAPSWSSSMAATTVCSVSRAVLNYRLFWKTLELRYRGKECKFQLNTYNSRWLNIIIWQRSLTVRLRLSSTQLLPQVVMASAQPGHSIGLYLFYRYLT